jgi:hypothetical protein
MPHPRLSAPESLHGYRGVPISTVEFQVANQTDGQCSSRVRQPGRLASDLHRPDMTAWPALATFIDLRAASYGSGGKTPALSISDTSAMVAGAVQSVVRTVTTLMICSTVRTRLRASVSRSGLRIWWSAVRGRRRRADRPLIPGRRSALAW